MKISSRRSKTSRKFLRVALSVLLLALIVTVVTYLTTYYHADESAIAALTSGDGVNVTAASDRKIIFEPAGAADLHTGLIFYPGGKVEYTAYAPLMAKLAKRGITCVLLKMPCNLAILNIDAADGVIEEYNSTAPVEERIDRWYLGGHSLGGVAAAMYLSKGHIGEYKGLVLIGSYSTKDLSDQNLSVITVIGENDGLVTPEKYEKYKSNLPADSVRYTVPGGCHAYFGSYGKQKGDGDPSISADEQQEYTADLIAAWVNQ